MDSRCFNQDFCPDMEASKSYEPHVVQGAEMILFLASERRKTTTNRPEMDSACARQRESAPYQAKDE